MLNAEGVNPLQTLSDISSALNGLLADSVEQFESIASSFGTTFESAAELFNGIAEDDRITLLLNAKLDVAARLELSNEEVSQSTMLNEAKTTLLAKMTDNFDVSIGGFGDVSIDPSIQLRLEVKNTATPFDLLEDQSGLGQISKTGYFQGIVNVGMDSVPTEISLRAYSPHLQDAASLEFDVRLDIDLVPIHDSEFVFIIYCHILENMKADMFTISQELMPLLMKFLHWLIQCGYILLLHIYQSSTLIVLLFRGRNI